jgi:RimJ/RimL family protein N-acetyltransferase
MTDREQAGDEIARVRTRDGREVLVRRLREEDRAALEAFGARLPRDDWLYLDLDFQSPTTINRLVNATEASNWRQLIALVGDEIAGYANVRLLPGWRRHVGDIALAVGEGYRCSGIGSVLAEAILAVAPELGVSKLILEIIEEQSAGRQIFKRLGFRLEGLLEDHAVDYAGARRNLILLAYHYPRPAADVPSSP